MDPLSPLSLWQHLEPENNGPLLRPGYFLGLEFKEGWLFFYIKSRTMSWIVPWGFSSSTSNNGALGTLATLTQITDDVVDAQGNRWLEPLDQSYINQIFFGLAPDSLNVYVRYPAATDISTLRGQRPTPGSAAVADAGSGAIGYLDGQISPFGLPSPATEIITLSQFWPRFVVQNPTPNTVTPEASFIIAKYRYQIVTGQHRLRSFMQGQARFRAYRFIDETLQATPQYLLNIPGVHESQEFAHRVVREITA